MTRESFTRRYLDPADRLNEILFGLIMVLTFTFTAGLTVGDGPDGAMYLLSQVFARRHAASAMRAVRAASDDATRLAIVDQRIEDVLGDSLVSLATPAERAQLRRMVRDVALRAPDSSSGLRREDVLGAVASGWLVIATTLPAVLPFLFIDEHWRALRVSNFLLVGLLFFAGAEWGRYGHSNRWLSGLAFLFVGLALVATTVALGG